MKRIVRKAINGDKNAFIEAVKPLEKKLYIIAKSKIHNEEDIKDVIQETILMGYKNIHQLKDESKFYSWLITILINNCNKFYSKRDNEYHILLDENIINENIESQHEKVENKIDFFILLELLEDLEKEIFILFYVEEYTTNKISNILNINENTVKTKLRRARQKIRDYIERWDIYGA